MTEAFRQLVNVLPRAAGPVADARQGLAVDQVGPDAVKRDRGAQSAIFDARLVGHPEQQTANDFEGEGAGFLTGLGIEVCLEYAGSPYHTELPRLDRAGWQQHWTIRHTQFPKWRFGFSEEAGTWTAPDITFFTAYRFGN